MLTKAEPKTACRTPAKGRDGVTNIPTWKFDLLHAAILASVRAAGSEGLAFKDLKDAVRPKIAAKDLDRLDSLGWHVTCVRLEMEVAGDIARLNGISPQRIVIA